MRISGNANAVGAMTGPRGRAAMAAAGDATGVVSLLEGAIPAGATVVVSFDYAALPSIALAEQYIPASPAEMPGVLPNG